MQGYIRSGIRTGEGVEVGLERDGVRAAGVEAEFKKECGGVGGVFGVGFARSEMETRSD